MLPAAHPLAQPLPDRIVLWGQSDDDALIRHCFDQLREDLNAFHNCLLCEQRLKCLRLALGSHPDPCTLRPAPMARLRLLQGLSQRFQLCRQVSG
jgi:hypothetical protein